MNDYPLVSIVIACYNHQNYVVETLDSILQDDYPVKEIVIVNDGSTDNSHEVINKWISEKGTHLKVIYSYRENRGVCKTINELIDISSGKYIIPVPSDDLLIPGTIRERISFLQNHPGKMVLISDAIVIDNNSVQIMDSTIEGYNSGDKKMFLNDTSILLSTLKAAQISGPSIVIDRDVYSITGKYKENMIAEDWYFYQRAAAKNLMIFYDKACGKYRVHDKNSSGTIMRGSHKMAWTIVLTYWHNWAFMPTLRYKVIALQELFKWYVRFCLYRISK